MRYLTFKMGFICFKETFKGKTVNFYNSSFFKETHNEIKANQDTFLRKFEALNRDEVTAALMCSFKDIEDTLAKEVSCVGCRRSVESKLILLF